MPPHSVVNDPITSGHIPTIKELGRIEESKELIITLESHFFNKVRKGIVRQTHNNKRITEEPKMIVTIETKICDNKGKESIMVALSTTLVYDTNTSHV